MKAKRSWRVLLFRFVSIHFLFFFVVLGLSFHPLLPPFQVFDQADAEDRAGKGNKNTAKNFNYAYVLFDALKQFGPLHSDVCSVLSCFAVVVVVAIVVRPLSLFLSFPFRLKRNSNILFGKRQIF
jgi:hypothetical protein